MGELSGHRGFNAGFCLKPKYMNRMPTLAASGKFMAPSRVDCRDYMTPTEDQGSKPWCAAYAVANWAESMLWRRDDTFEQIKPDWIYAYAKEHDGMPDVEGTTLTAALESLRGSVFDRDVCKVKVVKPSRLSFKYALHKFGAIVAGFNVSETWYGCTRDNPVISSVGKESLGGHAVICCGYGKDGVYVQNSWGARGWGQYGFGQINWDVFDAQVSYGAVLSNVLDGLTINT